jgi:hypothetical protein
VRLAAALGAVVSAGLYVWTATSPDRSLGDDLLSLVLFVAVGMVPFIVAGAFPFEPWLFALALAVATGLAIVDNVVLQIGSSSTSGVAAPVLPFSACIGVLMVAGLERTVEEVRAGRWRGFGPGEHAESTSPPEPPAPADPPEPPQGSAGSHRPNLVVRFLRGDPPLTEPVDKFAWYGWLTAWSLGVIGIVTGRDWIIAPAGALIILIGVMLTTNFRGVQDRLRVREERSKWHSGVVIASPFGGLVLTVIGLGWLYFGLGDLFT